MNYRAMSVAFAIIVATGSFAQTPDPAIVAKIRTEGLTHSQYMTTLEYLSDVIGQRLTGSPSLKRANEWTRSKLESYGLSNAHLEAWGPFGRGWQLDRFSAQVTAPYDIPLIAYPKAWSPSLDAPVTADVVLVDVKDEAGLAAFAGKLKGKIVLNGDERAIPARFTPQGSRYTDAELADMTKPQAPRTPGAGRPGAAGGAQNFRAAATLNAAKLRLFVQEGVAAVLDGSRGDDGTIFVQSAAVPTPAPVAAVPGATGAPRGRGPSVWEKGAPATVPQVTVSAEQYNRLVRMVKQGEKLKLNLDLKAEFIDTDPMCYNTVAEIPGSDLKDQVVMVGGHMDSWHSGTGATDNGAGVAVAMEAVRILKTLGIQPRRTIRVALWSGEEQGLFGSRAYVKQHLGEVVSGATPTDPKSLTKGPEWDKVSAYFNLDNGSGKIRGIFCQGNEKVAPIFADWLKPFADLGATTVTMRNTGSTDHVSFDAVGVPGFQFIQDTIEYDSRTHHSNQDVFDRIQEEDMKQASVIMATFLYQAATRDEMLPRKDVK